MNETRGWQGGSRTPGLSDRNAAGRRGRGWMRGGGRGGGGGRYEKKRKSGIVKAARLICILIYRAFARASSANSEMRRGCWTPHGHRTLAVRAKSRNGRFFFLCFFPLFAFSSLFSFPSRGFPEEERNRNEFIRSIACLVWKPSGTRRARRLYEHERCSRCDLCILSRISRSCPPAWRSALWNAPVAIVRNEYWSVEWIEI